jgi:hypothetical protein
MAWIIFFPLSYSKMSLLFEKAQKKILHQKIQSKEIQDPRISLGQNLKKLGSFLFVVVIFFSFEWTLIKPLKKNEKKIIGKSGDFLGIGHKLRNPREAESRGQRFVGNHWKFEVLLRSGGRNWSFKKSRDFIFGGRLDEAKKTVWIWEQKVALNLWPVPSWHFTDLFFFRFPLAQSKTKFSFSFLTRDQQVLLIKWFYFWLFIRASII